MGKRIMFMHHIALCTIMLFTHIWLISPIGHVYAEPELEVPTEQVQVEDFTNIVVTQGKPWCILPKSLSFISELYL
jgi:hypothetical protein